MKPKDLVNISGATTGQHLTVMKERSDDIKKMTKGKANHASPATGFIQIFQ